MCARMRWTRRTNTDGPRGGNAHHTREARHNGTVQPPPIAIRSCQRYPHSSACSLSFSLLPFETMHFSTGASARAGQRAASSKTTRPQQAAVLNRPLSVSVVSSYWGPLYAPHPSTSSLIMVVRDVYSSSPPAVRYLSRMSFHCFCGGCQMRPAKRFLLLWRRFPLAAHYSRPCCGCPTRPRWRGRS